MVLAAILGVASWEAVRFRPAPWRAPDFSLPEVEGGTISLSALRGKPVVLVFFRSYFCAPCRQQLAELKSLRERGGEILVLSREERELLLKLKKEEGIPFPFLLDDGRVARSFGLHRLPDGSYGPSVFILDGEGVVRWRQLGKHFADLAGPSRVRAEFRKVAGG